MKKSYDVDVRTSFEMTKTMFDNAPFAIIVYEVLNKGESSLDYIIHSVNPAGLLIEAWNKDEVLGKPLKLLRPGVDDFGIIKVFERVYKTGKTEHFPAAKYQEGDLISWYENIVYKLPTGNIVAVYEDITEKKLANERLLKEKERLKVTLHSIGDAVITTDIDGNIDIMNKVAEKLIGQKFDKVYKKPLKDVFVAYNFNGDSEEKISFDKLFKQKNKSFVKKDVLLISSKGDEIIIDLHSTSIKDEDGGILGIVLVFRDITMLKEKENHIEYLTYRDGLTDLYNRRFLENQLKMIKENDVDSYSIIMGDLDDLKLFNDVYGHDIGDLVLKNVANIIKNACRKTDLIARWGGDEFVVLLKDTSLDDAMKICERIDDLSRDYKIEETKVNISLGCAESIDKTERWEDVFKRAEDNMYKNKKTIGKSYRRIVFSSIKEALIKKGLMTSEHEKKIFRMCTHLGEELALNPDDLKDLSTLFSIYYIGNIMIDNYILKKAKELKWDNMEFVRTYPEMGYALAKSLPELTNVSEYLSAHNERWDGKGFPKGLLEEEIPLLSRITAVIGEYCRLSHNNSYTKDDIKNELKKDAAIRFDPEIVEIFIKYLDINDMDF